MMNRIPVSNKEQRVIKQEEYYDKYLLHGNLCTSRPECAVEDLLCPVCNASFKTEEALLEHQNRRKFHCDECKKCFEKEVKYWAHVVHVHPADSDSDSDSDPSLWCTSCKFMFPTEMSYSRHMAIIHQAGPVPLEELKVVQDNVQPTLNKFNYCTRCQFTFVRKEDFFTHLVRLHQIDMELDPYPIQVLHPDLVPDSNHPHHFCNACEYTFQNKANFLQHLRKQHAISDLQNQMEYEKPKKSHADRRCDACHITLNSRSSYKRHLGSKRHGYVLASLKVQSRKANPQKAKVANKQNQKKLKNTVTKLLQQLERKKKPQNVIVSSLLQQLQQHQETEDEQGGSSGRNEEDGYDESVEQHQPYVAIEQDTSSKPNQNIQLDIHNPYNFCTVCKYKFSRNEEFRGHLANVHSIPEDQLLHLTCFRKRVNYVTLMTELDLKGVTVECRLCCGLYRTTALYNDHFKNSHKDVTLSPAYLNLYNSKNQCTACNRSFYSFFTYKTHLETMHGIRLSSAKRPILDPDINDPSNSCNLCKRSYASRLNYLKHLECVHQVKLPNIRQLAYNGKTPDVNDPNNYCIACEKTFAARGNYVSHLVKFHDVPRNRLVNSVNYSGVPDVNNRNNTCTACKRTYGNNRSFLTHLARVHGKHLPDKASAIDNTGAVSGTGHTGALLSIHESDNKCNVCGKEYHSKRNFRNHLMDEHGYHLPKAEQPATEDNLPKRKTSTSASHPRETSIKTSPQGKISTKASQGRKMFTCDTCQATYASASIYHYHLVQAHGAELQGKKIHLPAWINLNETPDLNGPTNTCTACKRKYTSYHSFTRHLARIHRIMLPKEPPKIPIYKRTGDVEPDVNDPRNWCAACNRVYASKYNYRAHLKIRHRMKIPAYSVKADLYREESPPHPPPKARQAQLTTPVTTRKASRVIKHSCSECDTTFFCERELSIHMKFVHEIEKPASRKRGTKAVHYNDAGRAHNLHLVVKEEESIPSLDEVSSRNANVLQFK